MLVPIHSEFMEPIVTFAILLVVILTVPLMVERLQLPGLVGLLAAGIALGPNGLGLLGTESETMHLLSDIGLVYLMFVAGLEVDMEQFRRTRNRSMGFGSFTFIVPLVMGTVVGRAFGFDWNPAILIGSLFASHTLLAYPIVRRLGIVNNEAVTVTIGATIFTDIGALLVLAICIGIQAGSFTLTQLLILLGSLAIYSLVVLFGFDWAGREFFRRSGDDEGNQFLFVLMALFLAALGAELIGVEKIVGAFLAGLAVNDAIGEGPVKEKVVFVGSVLFIPIFFVNLGLLINLPAFIASLGALKLTLAIVIGLISSKFVAAFLAQWVYRYSRLEMLTMWSLSIPQVGATLAATLVGYRAGLLTEDVLNSVIVLMLVTSTVGPLITSRVAPKLKRATVTEIELESVTDLTQWEEEPTEDPFTVVVPVYNPHTEDYLVEMAAILAKHESGQVIPVAIAPAFAHMDAPELDASLSQSETLLAKAIALAEGFEVTVNGLLRIDDNIAKGISHTSRERRASLIVMGWSQTTGLRARLFGNVLDSVIWAAHCPVAVTHLLDSPTKIRRILVPVKDFTQQAMRMIRFAEILADANQAQVLLLHICNPRTSASQMAWTKSQLTLLVEKGAPHTDSQIQVIPAEDVTKAILEASQSVDLVVLRSLRRRTSGGGLAFDNVATQVVKQLQCSVVMLGEPQWNAPRANFLDRQLNENRRIV
ncbi:cation:proton antiporter [Desertifilum sp. FACHB-1129]|nr:MULTISPECIES: cation:proton antiporter [unclassified Desertifilum]MBD2314675.1 cation:proton antiporter [Desertifilum sp. FACHB-1129]MBD2320265.1 cation:proton antiporter [Desertifilum sp. FACHB-866]MBD2330393.1 cation:proton antiporter [Desertifilum sp. FACHB-868]MDA0211303.1 cation:proton antiporter [Cyanobacteria bacterium FC1]